MIQLLNVYQRDCGRVERAEYTTLMLSYCAISEPHRSYLPGHPSREAKASRYREGTYGWQGTHNTHPSDDFVAVLQRARDAGVRAQIITGGSLSESKEALQLAKEHGTLTLTYASQSLLWYRSYPSVTGLYATIGCHPTRSSEMSNYPESGVEGYLAALDRVISEHLSGVGRVVAVGECGLGILNPFGERSSDLTLSLRLRPIAFLRRRDTT